MGFIYAYCITKGIKDTEILTKVNSVAENNHVKILNFEDVQVVVSVVEPSEFSSEVINRNIENLCWLEEKAMAHENIIEEIMENFTVLPFRFMSIYQDEENIRGLLKEHYAKIIKNLWTAENNFEFGIKVFCNREFLNEQKSKTNNVGIEPDSEVRYILRKINPLIDNIILRDIEDENDSSLEMVLNAVVLVNKVKYKTIKHDLNKISAKLVQEGYFLEKSQPWPMCSFIELI